MNPEDIRLVMGVALAIIGAYAFITRPLLKVIDTQSKSVDKSLEANTKSIDARLDSLKTEIKAEIKSEIADVKIELKAMESRLNQRIDTYIVRR